MNLSMNLSIEELEERRKVLYQQRPPSERAPRVYAVMSHMIMDIDDEIIRLTGLAAHEAMYHVGDVIKYVVQDPAMWCRTLQQCIGQVISVGDKVVSVNSLTPSRPSIDFVRFENIKRGDTLTQLEVNKQTTTRLLRRAAGIDD